MAANDTPKNADFVQKIVSDAKNPPQTRTLTGWFGDAGKKGFRRLYTDAQLSSYSDIPTDAILHSEPVKDSQPPGAAMVWVKADAQVDSSSASSRASRFLQGDLTKELLGEGAADRGGFRCVTSPPCAEPTGFTGLCTKQPDVGGCWPCITAIPHCAEPTGFTGKCTHVPWPLPTHYAGCTIFHCPTFDLTCIPQVCNAIASGIPGCGGGNPVEQGGGPQEKAGAAADAARIPKTELLGCGFTKEWGLCQTQLLHCQPSVNNPCITQTEMGPRCQTLTVNIDAAQQGGQVGAGGAGIAIRPTLAPTVFICCNPSIFHRQCPTRQIFCTRFGPTCPTQKFECTSFGPQCPPTPGIICTQFGTCGGGGPSAVDACPSSLGCPPGGGGFDPAAGGAAFGAAAPAAAQRQPVPVIGTFNIQLCNPSIVDACPTGHGCPVPTQPVAQCNPSIVDACPTVHAPNCTQAPTQLCTKIAQACPTQFGKPCPTACGPDCQTQQYQCTQYLACPTSPLAECTMLCTHVGPKCPTVMDPNCNIVDTINQQPQVGAGAGAFPPSIGIACTLPNFCPTTLATECPTMNPQTCTTIICTQMCPGGGVQQGAGGFGAQAAAAGPAANIALPLTQSIACPTRIVNCPSPFCPPTRVPHLCFSPIPFHCPTPFPITCPNTQPLRCPPSPFCPVSQFCPSQIIPACPTRIICQVSPIPQCGGGASLGACPSIACQQQQFPQVQPQQQQQFGAGAGSDWWTGMVCHGAQQQVGDWWTGMVCHGAQQQAGDWWTGMVCHGAQQQAGERWTGMPCPGAQQQVGEAAFFPNPTPATRCFICPQLTFDFRCGTQAVNTAGPYWCPTWPMYLCRIDI